MVLPAFQDSFICFPDLFLIGAEFFPYYPDCAEKPETVAGKGIGAGMPLPGGGVSRGPEREKRLFREQSFSGSDIG